jgi:hypothetical protein
VRAEFGDQCLGVCRWLQQLDFVAMALDDILRRRRRRAEASAERIK